MHSNISSSHALPRGLTRVDGIISAALMLLLGGSMFFAVWYVSRVSRDTARLSEVRQAQFDLASYRHAHAAYPGTADPLAPAGFGYQPKPEGCTAGTETACVDYELTFTLEGALGPLSGGECLATQSTLTCKGAE